jgi:hypothetical protein
VTTYRIVPDRSAVSIAARSNVHPIHTQTTGLEGELRLELGGDGLNTTVDPSGWLELAVDLLRSGNLLQDRELKRRIDARRYPTIRGDIKGMAADGAPGRLIVTGDVTFRGVTKTHEGEVTMAADGRTVRFAGTATFDVRDFGMDPPKILMLRVEPEVEVSIDVLAEAEE